MLLLYLGGSLLVNVKRIQLRLFTKPITRKQVNENENAEAKRNVIYLL
jgi:hypothetical protein